MTIINLWTILGATAIILLVIYWKNKNAVWGGLTIGVIIGFLLAIIYLFKGDGFSWFVIGKGAALGTILGFIAELLGKIKK